MTEIKENNVSFENIKILASLSNEGTFLTLVSNIRKVKQDLDNVTKEARIREKQLQTEIEEKSKNNLDAVQPAAPENTEVQKETVAPSKPLQEESVKTYVIKQNQTQNNYSRNSYSQNNYSQNNGFDRNRFNKPITQNAQNTQNTQNTQRPFNPNNRTTGFNKPPFEKKPFERKPFENRPYLNKDKKPDFLKTPLPKFAKTEKVLPKIEPDRVFTPKKKTDKKYEDKKVINKRTLLRRGLIEERNIEERMLSRKIRTKKHEEVAVVPKEQGPCYITTTNLTVKILSECTGKSVSEIIKKFMLLGMLVTINSPIDFQTAELVASELNIELELKIDKTSEEKLHDVRKNIKQYTDAEAQTRPPIVTVMGHVDHGKTSLLDYIRKSKVSVSEAGGITQHIGAYRVNVNNKFITFIDTPGHEAFTQMRARGAMVTDIAILVIAADDGIMPQTVEAINHIKSANVPLIVAINKIDKPGADPDRILQQLTEHNIIPEAWGGNAIIVKISAKTGEGIDKLLEMILLVSEMGELKANPNTQALGVVLESNLDKGKGPMASLIVKDGTLNVGDTIVSGVTSCKVKAMIDEFGKNIIKATPSMPISVVGFNEVPNAGDLFTTVDEKLSKEIVSERKTKIRSEINKHNAPNNLEDIMSKIGESDKKIVNVLIKTDVNGSLEAIKGSLESLNNDYARINIIHSGVGSITESDIVLAEASKAIILGFNAKTDSKAKTIAERNNVEIKNYKVIYTLLDDIERIIKGLKDPVYKEEILGHAEVLVVFKLTGTGLVAGSLVKDGKIRRNANARLIRGGEVISTCTISSVKIVKDDVKEAAKGFECGIKLNCDDIKVGDTIECYEMVKVEE